MTQSANRWHLHVQLVGLHMISQMSVPPNAAPAGTQRSCQFGIQHHTPEGRQRDRQRDDFLRKKGFTVLRFTNVELIRDISAVVKKVEQYVQEQATR